MSARAAITVHRPREETQRLWETTEHAADFEDAKLSFTDAPGDRGTEIHVELPASGVLDRVTSAGRLAKVKDELRQFKQRYETGEIARSDGAPEGERAERKFTQRPAQPPAEVGAR